MTELSSQSALAKRLTPQQERVVDGAVGFFGRTNIIVLWGEGGYGRTTMLKAVHQRKPGVFLDLRPFVERMEKVDPLALEETLFRYLSDAMDQSKVVYFDDLELIQGSVCCNYGYPRRGWMDGPLDAIALRAEAEGHTLVFSSGGRTPDPLKQRAVFFGIKELKPDDFGVLLQSFFGARASAIDPVKVHRFAPRLNAWQLRGASQMIEPSAVVTTELLIETLREKNLVSNVDLGLVRPVSLDSLRGLESLVRELEAKIVLPMENDQLSAELGLLPKRGVLLVGPPGTGKTTVGRALAHRLKGKFFSIDGTIISGTRNFYQQVGRVFELARQNAPSVIFIDDSDVIFESGRDQGLYRYLLTMLDGLESENVAKVCVMLTAMNVGALPPALVRSGRIELWLETSLPDAAARQAILQDSLAQGPKALQDVALGPVVEKGEGLTGADLQRLVADARLLYAYDVARSEQLKPIDAYFLEAVDAVRTQRQRYLEAMEAVRQAPRRPEPDLDFDDDE